MEEYVNENTIIKDDVYEKFQDDITCSLCQHLMIYPVMCMNCMNIYCKKCIEDWKQKGGGCPNQCDEYKFKDVIEKNNHITKFKFKCIKGCGAEIPFLDINKHYSENCSPKKYDNRKLINMTPEEAAEYKDKIGEDIPHINIITLGAGHVGKTSIINAFLNSKFNENMLMTQGIDFFTKTFQLSDGSAVNCLIYDTTGQEKFRAINTQYYRKANAILLLYDITYKKSFDEIKEYYSKEIRERCKKNIPVVLIGNKLDLVNERKVSQEEAILLAKQENYIYKETSCKTNENVANAFEALVELWRNEERKKVLIGERSNSDEFRKNKKRENSSVFNFENPSTAVFTRRKNNENPLNESFKLKKTPNIESEKCSC